MNNLIMKLLVVFGALLMTVVLVKLMYEMNDSVANMSASVTEMTAYVGALSKDVAKMDANMQQMALNVAEMNHSMQRIEGSMQGMGQAISHGSEQFQQWNPADMIRQVIPEDGRPRR